MASINWGEVSLHVVPVEEDYSSSSWAEDTLKRAMELYCEEKLAPVLHLLGRHNADKVWGFFDFKALVLQTETQLGLTEKMCRGILKSFKASDYLIVGPREDGVVVCGVVDGQIISDFYPQIGSTPVFLGNREELSEEEGGLSLSLLESPGDEETVTFTAIPIPKDVTLN